MNYLREMKTEDVDAVIKVIASHSEEDAEEAESDYREVGGIMDQYVIEDDGSVIGVTGFLSPSGCEQTYWLSWTYVADGHDNKGHGRKMLIDLLDYLQEQGGRKIFVKVSDYVDDEDGAIYAAALHLYKSLGFKEELKHEAYYTDSEAQMILGLRLNGSEPNIAAINTENCPVQFNAVFEIDETDDAYSFGWHDEGESIFTKEDVEMGLAQVKEDEGRVVFLSFPSNFSDVSDTLLSAGFVNAGVLDDYYEDGIHEQHFTYKF